MCRWIFAFIFFCSLLQAFFRMIGASVKSSLHFLKSRPIARDFLSRHWPCQQKGLGLFWPFLFVLLCKTCIYNMHDTQQLDESLYEVTLTKTSSYILRRSQNFGPSYSYKQKSGRWAEFLWPSQNIWTLIWNLWQNHLSTSKMISKPSLCIFSNILSKSK